MPVHGKSLQSRLALAGAAVILLLWALIPQPAYGITHSRACGPRLMRALPGNSGLMGRDVCIALSFDRPMDLASISQAASFQPPLTFTVSGEAECLIVPSNLLEGGHEYTFRLDPGRAQDCNGNVFEGEVELDFVTRSDGMAIEVPRMGYSGAIVEGKDPEGVASVLGFGVGHYPGTGRPGGGNLVLMAHASGQIDFPFNHLQDLQASDEIRVRYGGMAYLYRLDETMVVPDNAMWILGPEGHPMLTMFVCCAADGKASPAFHPPYRYVVRAILIGAMP